MDEREFIRLLQKRAKDQHKEIANLPFPKIFDVVSTFLSDHPWRLLIPLAFVIVLVTYGIFGRSFTEFVLQIFY